MRLAHRLLRVNRLDRFGVGVDLAAGLALQQLNALVPVKDVVGVLSQLHAVGQQWTPRYEVLQTGQPAGQR